MASKIIQLLERHTNLNITDNILSNLGIADIFALHATCRALRWLLGQMTESPYLLNVNKQLGHYVRDPSRFRYELGKCDGIICGDFVQTFLERNSHENPILHILIQEGPKSCQFMEYLLSSEDVILHHTHDNGGHCFQPTYDLLRYIWVERTPRPPITELINFALTTVDLYFMTWNKAYSLLPVANLKKHKFYPLKPFEDQWMACRLRNLAEVGWTTRDLLWPDQTRDCIPQGELHRIGGPKTLTIKLADPPDGEFTPDFVVESGIFSITHDSACFRHELAIEAQAFGPSPALRYQYVWPCRGQEFVSWAKFLRSKLTRWMFVELVKMHSDSWPPEFNIRSGPDGLKLPPGYTPPPGETWTFADVQIGPWFAEWKRGYEETQRSGHVMPI